MIEHNTAMQDGSVICARGVAHRNFVYRNNVSPRADHGIFLSFAKASFAQQVIGVGDSGRSCCFLPPSATCDLYHCRMLDVSDNRSKLHVALGIEAQGFCVIR